MCATRVQLCMHYQFQFSRSLSRFTLYVRLCVCASMARLWRSGRARLIPHRLAVEMVGVSSSFANQRKHKKKENTVNKAVPWKSNSYHSRYQFSSRFSFRLAERAHHHGCFFIFLLSFLQTKTMCVYVYTNNDCMICTFAHLPIFYLFENV